jgi:hypothetical protein
VADDLLMAFQQQDLDKLDKVKLSPQLFYLDSDVQALLKALNFFDMEFPQEPQEELLVVSAGKSALFGGAKVRLDNVCLCCMYVCMYVLHLCTVFMHVYKYICMYVSMYIL